MLLDQIEELIQDSKIHGVEVNFIIISLIDYNRLIKQIEKKDLLLAEQIQREKQYKGLEILITKKRLALKIC